jgi:transposase-like protein
LVIYTKKNGNLTEMDKLAGELDATIGLNQGDRWTFVAVLPESGFIHTVHSGERSLAEAQVFVGKIKEQSDQSAPLFHSDCWFYEQALRDNYCEYVPKPYSGRGRRPHPVQVIDPNLRYVQVHKARDSKGKIEKMVVD